MITRNAQPAAGHDEPPGVRQSYAKGQIVYRQDDRATHWYEVFAGIVRTCRLYSDGRRQVMGFFYPGDVFGIDPGSYKASAEAVTAYVETLRHPVEAIASDARALRRALRSAEDCIYLLGHRTAAERIAAFLIAFARRTRSGARIALPMSRADIADHLGLTIETVSRSFSECARRGLIALDAPQRIRVLDPARLLALAGDDEPTP